MAHPSTRDEDDAADVLYARRSSLFAAKTRMQPSSSRWGVREWTAYLSDPSAALPPEQQRALFADKRLREDFRQLKNAFSMVALPALAAASDGAVVERTFDGGTVRLHAARKPGQYYAIFNFGPRSVYPTTLVLETPAGEQLKRVLPAADLGFGREGEIMIVGEMSDVDDQKFHQLLSDPSSVGHFLA